MQISPRIGIGTISAIINSNRAKKHFNRGKKAVCIGGNTMKELISALSWEFNCILLALYFTIRKGIQVKGAIYTLQGTRIAPKLIIHIIIFGG